MIELSLPDGWRMEPLGRSITSLVDGPFGSNLASEHYVEEGARVIRLGNIGVGHFKDNDRAFISLERYERLKRHAVEADDVVVAGLGDINNPLGRACRVPANLGPGIVKADCFRLRVDRSRIESDFLIYFLSSALGEWAAKSKSRGSTRQRMNPRDVASLRLPMPPLEEQRRIADFLDAETARIDRLRSLRDSQRSLVEERLFARVSGAFSLDGSVDLVRLGYLAKVQTGITVDAARSTAGDVVTRPYLRVANVQAGYLALDSVTEITVPVRVANSSTLRPGDVLMTEGGDLDKLGRGTAWKGEIPNCLHQNHVFAVRPDHRLDPEYLALLTRTAYARKYFESTGTKSTNLASTSSSKIRDFRVPLVPIAHQKDISRRLNSELRQGESLLATLEEQQRLLEERRRAVITAAVTGELDVTTARRS